MKQEQIIKINIINQIKNLPATDQDASVMRLMEELKDELDWNKSFSQITDEQWNMITNQVYKEIKNRII